MPDGRYFPNMVYYPANGKIYVIGGFNTSFVEDTQTWEYDPVANTWNTSRAPIPVPMAGAGTSIVGQFIYLAGSWNGGLGSTLHYRYDILGDSWVAMAPVPVNIYAPAAAAVGMQTYLVGGGNPFLGPSANAQARKQASLAAPVTSYNSTYIYDTVSNTWSSGPNTNVPHSFTGGTAIGARLLVVGGYNGTADTNTVETATVPCVYALTQTTPAPFVPGVTNIGNSCDDCSTVIALPFPVTLYDQTYTSAAAGSNGYLAFGTDFPGFGISCWPAPRELMCWHLIGTTRSLSTQARVSSRPRQALHPTACFTSSGGANTSTRGQPIELRDSVVRERFAAFSIHL